MTRRGHEDDVLVVWLSRNGPWSWSSCKASSSFGQSRQWAGVGSACIVAASDQDASSMQDTSCNLFKA